ncbi:MerR family transcriptional regulator [Agrococcus versicolor]|uniref:MerR family transcriptional regulator n=1 Tax=Agrococcus versicolor TaxID=501482 RepID=A0ABN3AXD6_9MICO
MHVREVGAAAGVSVALVKFYVREGLLHPGVRESANSTSYDDSHVARLRLIRALVEGGRLPLAAVGELLDAIDDDTLPIDVVVRDAHRAVARVDHCPSERALALVREAAEANGWLVSDDNPGIAQCAAVLDTALAVGREDVREMLDVYAEPVELIAREDLAAVGRAAETRVRMAETVILGSVFGDAMLLGMRRMAQEHLSRARMAGSADAERAEHDRPAHDAQDDETTARRTPRPGGGSHDRAAAADA